MPGSKSRSYMRPSDLYSQLLLRSVTDDDFDEFVAVEIRMGTVEKTP
jgi:hypothetical protein